jgi:hypothetical protein
VQAVACRAGRRRRPDRPSACRVRAIAGRQHRDVLPGPDGPLPLLILDQRPEMAVRSGPAERLDLSVSGLLSMGLTLVTTISEAGPGIPDVIEVGEPLAPAPGWRLVLSGRRAQLRVASSTYRATLKTIRIIRSGLIVCIHDCRNGHTSGTEFREHP